MLKIKQFFSCISYLNSIAKEAYQNVDQPSRRLSLSWLLLYLVMSPGAENVLHQQYALPLLNLRYAILFIKIYVEVIKVETFNRMEGKYDTYLDSAWHRQYLDNQVDQLKRLYMFPSDHALTRFHF